MIRGFSVTHPANETDLLRRITSNPGIFGGKPIIRNRRLAVEHARTNPTTGDRTRMRTTARPRSAAEPIG